MDGSVTRSRGAPEGLAPTRRGWAGPASSTRWRGSARRSRRTRTRPAATPSWPRSPRRCSPSSWARPEVEVPDLYQPSEGYVTPKVDVRAAVFDDAGPVAAGPRGRRRPLVAARRLGRRRRLPGVLGRARGAGGVRLPVPAHPPGRGLRRPRRPARRSAPTRSCSPARSVGGEAGGDHETDGVGFYTAGRSAAALAPAHSGPRHRRRLRPPRRPDPRPRCSSSADEFGCAAAVVGVRGQRSDPRRAQRWTSRSPPACGSTATPARRPRVLHLRLPELEDGRRRARARRRHARATRPARRWSSSSP